MAACIELSIFCCIHIKDDLCVEMEPFGYIENLACVRLSYKAKPKECSKMEGSPLDVVCHMGDKLSLGGCSKD